MLNFSPKKPHRYVVLFAVAVAGIAVAAVAGIAVAAVAVAWLAVAAVAVAWLAAVVVVAGIAVVEARSLYSPESPTEWSLSPY